jgi:hypothetical protein
VLPVDIFQIERRAKKGLLNIFSREKLIDVIISVRRGWILGSILGEEQSRRSDSSSYRKWGLTALLDLDHRQAVFTCVEPYLESYKDTNYFRSTTWEIVAWVEAAQAVRQLIMLRHLGIQSIFTRKIPTKQGNKSLERVQVPAGRLGFIRIEEGKEPGRIYEIHEELSIGRSRDRNIFLEDSAMDELDELYASVINQGNGNYVLEVDTEQQRIKVNGQPLPPKDYRGYQTYPLQDGDRIQLDQTAAWGGWGSYVQPGQVVLVFGTK